MAQLLNLTAFLDIPRKNNQLPTIDTVVNPNHEIAEIHRRVIDLQGPALLFTNMKGSAFPVVTNLFGTNQRLEAPVFFDCRMPPWYTDVLEVDAATMALVDGKINSILPPQLR